MVVRACACVRACVGVYVGGMDVEEMSLGWGVQSDAFIRIKLATTLGSSMTTCKREVNVQNLHLLIRGFDVRK